MTISKFITHYFFPHELNNLKPKLLHSSSILFISLLLLFYQSIIYFLPKTGLSVLGYAASISLDEVVRLTNEKRVALGLSPLTLNPTLSQAAKNKGEDMLNRDYWSHIAPDGTEPWTFFTNVGYKYRFAGENLARDFSNAASAVDAWMASPSHKDNLLSSKYQEIGVAVVEGDLAGADTTIIVQLFGTPYSGTTPSISEVKNPVSAVMAKEQEVETTVTPKEVVADLGSDNKQALVIEKSKTNNLTSGEKKSFFSPFKMTRNASMVVIGLLLVVLVIDGVWVSNKNYARISGRTFAHISFLGMILAATIILKAGKIL